MKEIDEVFNDIELVKKIKNRLPYLFQLAEVESMRGGKIGMEVGSTREKIIVSLLIHKFGIKNIKTKFPITESEVDVAVYEKSYSIKTITQKKLTGGIKLIWTVDSKKAEEFKHSYTPGYGMILIHINWTNIGGVYYFSKSIQKNVLNMIGNEDYIKLPKKGTNPRGIEISGKALKLLINHEEKKFIPISWTRTDIDYNPFKRWVDYWEES